MNLTHHSYFNLDGRGRLLRHQLFIDADRYPPVDETLIPTGELRAVTGSPFDFREPRPIGGRIDEADPQLRRANGYDHNFGLAARDPRLRSRRAFEPRSGRTWRSSPPSLESRCTPAWRSTVRSTGRGDADRRHAGLCLETQHFPDSPNQPAFPSARLNPDEEYSSQTVYRFSTAPPRSGRADSFQSVSRVVTKLSRVPRYFRQQTS